MFIVSWEGEPPSDRSEWIRVLREVLLTAAGSYRVRFFQTPAGWRFEADPRTDLGPPHQGEITNTAESVRFNLQYLLAERGMPMDPGWDPTQD